VKLGYSIQRIDFRCQVPGARSQVKTTNKKSFLICVHLRPIIFFFFFVFSLQSLAGTKGQIEGSVVDAKTGKSLSYVNIIIVGTSLGADCQSDGSYHITNISPGIYDIQARGIGYLPLTVTGVLVEADHSTQLDLELFAPRTIKAKDVTIEAEKEIINMDMSSRRYCSNIEEIIEIPLVSDIEDYLAFYSLRERLGYMERENPDILYMTDGFPVLDNRLNFPVLMPPLSAVSNVVVSDGGFGAEYGNVSSCVVNVIEKEGGRDSYHGSADFGYTFPHMPHHGSSIFSLDNVHIRPFVDTTDSLCWNGTSVLPEEEADDYEDFEGWIQYAQDRESEGDTLNANEWRDLFMYVYRTEGSDTLGQTPGSYGDKPGYVIDFGFGGPFPGVNILTFFVSNVRKVEPFSLPVTRENYVMNKTDWKITFHLKPEIKLNIKGLFEIIETVTSDSREIYPDGRIWAQSGGILNDVGRKDFMYWVDALNPYNIRRYGWGFDLNHSLSPSTFYNLKIFYSRFRHSSTPIWEEAGSDINFRDTTDLISFGNISIPREIPFGYESFTDNYCYYRDLLPAGFLFSNYGRTQGDTSRINTINFSAEVTSQITSNHQLKGGIQINHDQIYSHMYSSISGATVEIADEVLWSVSPIRAGFYLQDKFSFEKSYTKLGLRLDYYNLGRNNAKWKISPRLGISTPIGKFGKFYFNFGYFYELPESERLYGEYTNYIDSIGYRGNPQLDFPEKISYELGFEKSLFDQYLFGVSAYHSDYDNQIGEVNFDGDRDISYSTYASNFYGDMKGFEISLRKRYGKLFRGFLKYNLNMGSYKGVGIDDIQIKSKGSLRLLLTFDTSDDWGKVLKNISSSILYTRRGGDYFSYDPYADDPFAPDDPAYINNLKWQDEAYCNLLLSKDVSLRGFTFSFYAEVNNLFDSKYITNDNCFRGDSANTDKIEYLHSLHLPMYREERYALDTLLIDGNDRAGEVDKDYIDKPDFEYLYFTNPRFLRLGVRVDF